LMGKSDYDFFPREQADFFRAKDEETFNSGDKVSIDEEPITNADGEQHVLATTKVLLRAADGDYQVGIIHDITKLKEAEATLRNAKDVLEQRVDERTAELARSNEALQRFAYSAFHELSAPSLAIIRLSEWLLEDVGGQLEPNALSKLELVNKRAHR